MKQHDLAGALNIKGEDRRAFRHTLRDMERRGKIVRIRKNRWALPDAGRMIIGDLSVHVNGFGFVIPEDPSMPDIFIPERKMGVALHGDRVQVMVSDPSSRGRSRRGRGRRVPEDDDSVSGRVVRVVERRRTVVSGRLRKTPYYWYVIPDNPRIPHSIRVDPSETDVPFRSDHKVLVRLREWDNAAQPPEGVVEEDLGHADAPGVDVTSLMRGYGIDPTFSRRSESQAKKTQPASGTAVLNGRRDLRDMVTFTIDPEDAKDYDDAVSLVRAPDGRWELGVHIADVPHYVPQGSSIDLEAYERGNSVYLVDRVITMLPPDLTSNVCSLNPREDRLTHTVSLVIDRKGSIQQAETYRSVIHSSARLTYEQVQQLFDGDRAGEIPEPVRHSLLEMRELASVLRKKREREGALLFNTPEVRCVLNDEGKPVRFVKRTAAEEAYDLIEEFMLAANQAVARRLSDVEAPAVFRVHDEPEEEQWGRMAEDLSALGIDATPTSRRDINALASSVTGDAARDMIHLSILRNLKRAVYSAHRSEHFGLAFDHYTHFTSPIRRYADLAVHRILCALEEGEPPPYSIDEVQQIASQCTRMEQNADDAEQESLNLKRLEYYSERLKNRETGPYKAVVVGFTPKGLLVELDESLQRGMVPFGLMSHGDYMVNRARNKARSRGRKRGWTFGDNVNVDLVRVDRDRKQVDFRLTEDSPPARAGRKTGKRTKGRKK